MDDIVTRLRSTCKADKDCPHAPCLGYCLPLEAADEIERLRREVLELHGVIRAHEGMYARAAEQIDRLRDRVDELVRENEHLATQVATHG